MHVDCFEIIDNFLIFDCISNCLQLVSYDNKNNQQEIGKKSET